jgi:RimJ/RimL family protein N-acetyltransferase
VELLYGEDAFVADWVCRKAPHAENGFEKYVAIGVVESGKLIAGCVYNEYHPGVSIHVSIASTSPKWCNRRILKAFFGYPFLQMKVKRLTAYTGKSMASVRQFLERLGFQQEGIMRQGFADDDVVIYGMLRSECPWLERTCREKLPVSACCA